MTEVRLHGVSKTWPNGRAAVVDLDWKWRAGKLTVLVGASGSGKTTTLRLVAGLETPTTGKICFDGKDQAACAPHERQVALVPQSPGLFPQWTVRKNMEGGRSGSVGGSLQMVAELLQIDSLLDRYPGEISGGEQQRVALGRAMLGSKRLWLMDEPLGQLDGWLRHEVRRALRQSQQAAGVTTLVVTHDPDEAFALADELAVMDGGRLLQVGTPAEVYDQPADLTVARLFGRGGMNLWQEGPHPGPLAEGEGVRQVWLGVRAEDLHVAGSSEPSDGKLADLGCGVVAKGREFFGQRWLVPIKLSDTTTVRVTVTAADAESMAVGDKVRLEVCSDRLHYFSVETGKRIEKLEQFKQLGS